MFTNFLQFPLCPPYSQFLRWLPIKYTCKMRTTWYTSPQYVHILYPTSVPRGIPDTHTNSPLPNINSAQDRFIRTSSVAVSWTIALDPSHHPSTYTMRGLLSSATAARRNRRGHGPGPGPERTALLYGNSATKCVMSVDPVDDDDLNGR